MLKTTFLSVKEICGKSGFGDTNHYIREFRRMFAMSPGQYRRTATIDSKQPESAIARAPGEAYILDSLEYTTGATGLRGLETHTLAAPGRTK